MRNKEMPVKLITQYKEAKKGMKFYTDKKVKYNNTEYYDKEIEFFRNRLYKIKWVLIDLCGFNTNNPLFLEE